MQQTTTIENASEDRADLLALLRRHGFHTAAENWKEGGWFDHDRAIRTWVDYPRSMDRYPSQLLRVEDKWMNRK